MSRVDQVDLISAIGIVGEAINEGQLSFKDVISLLKAGGAEEVPAEERARLTFENALAQATKQEDANEE